MPEKDYLSILGFLGRLYECRSRSELRNCIQDQLLPLVDAQSATWCWIDSDIDSGKARQVDAVGSLHPEGFLGPSIASDPPSVQHVFDSTTRSVLIHDGNACPSCPPDSAEALPQKNDFPSQREGIELLLADPPDFQVGLGIQRTLAGEVPFSPRDVRVVELIQPHLTQVIKNIALSEELSRYKAFAEALAAVSTAIVLTTMDHRILFRNAAFSRILPLDTGHRLPREIVESLEQKDGAGPFSLEDWSPRTRVPFVKLPNGIFRLAPTLLNPDGEPEDRCRLVKLKPAIEPYAKMNYLMQEAGLTARQIEIACLIRDGLDNQEIAEHLFISLHTTKNHIKNLFQKLGIHSRTKLIALLNEEPLREPGD